MDGKVIAWEDRRWRRAWRTLEKWKRVGGGGGYVDEAEIKT